MIERRDKRIRRIPTDTIHYGGAEYAEKNGAKALSAPEQPGESPGFEFPEPIEINQLERPAVHLHGLALENRVDSGRGGKLPSLVLLPEDARVVHARAIGRGV